MRFPLRIAVLAIASSASLHAASFTVSNVNDSGPGSLHQAINDANAAPGHDDIVFNIPGAGVHKIDIQHRALPEVTGPVTIDGYTQPGAKPNTRAVGNDAVILIQIDAAANHQTGPETGLVLSGGNSTVRGLSITGVPGRTYVSFPENPTPPPLPTGDSIVLQTNGGNVIEGNFIGVSPTGIAEGFNYTYRGIRISSDDNRVGGTSPAARNVVSQNSIGISVGGARTRIEGNYIGSDASGTQKSGGADSGGNGIGISVFALDARIGGTAPGAGNLIAGNETEVSLGSRDAVVQGNRIGPGINGNQPLERLSRGIRVGGSGHLIGGLQPGAANEITGGITVGSRNSGSTQPRRNSLLSNVQLNTSQTPIDLGDNQTTRNDLGDADVGPNDLQNFPVITQVTRGEETVTVKGGLNSARATTFTLQFYRMASFAAPSELLGTERVTTDEAGIAYFEFTFPARTEENDFISATATAPDGSTSEFFPFNGSVQMANLSTRGHVGTGDNILIGGFIVRRPFNWFSDRDFSKRVLVRAIGPSLATAGFAADRVLQDPTLELRDSDGALIAQNDDWRDGQQQEIAASNAAPAHADESALIATLPEGTFTALVRGVGETGGLGLIEIFDLDPLDPVNTPGSGRLINISTRGRVGTADEVLIGGIIINGDAGQRLMARAIGADLAAVGLRDALLDPMLELRDASGNLIAANDDWKETQQREVESTGLIPTNEQNSAIVTTLIPGLYTATVRGKNGTTGLAVVEFYDLRR